MLQEDQTDSPGRQWVAFPDAAPRASQALSRWYRFRISGVREHGLRVRWTWVCFPKLAAEGRCDKEGR